MHPVGKSKMGVEHVKCVFSDLEVMVFFVGRFAFSFLLCLGVI